VNTAASLTFVKPTVNQEFPITADAVMPVIDVEVKVESSGPAPLYGIGLTWTAELSFTCKNCPHGPVRLITHPKITGLSPTGKFQISFSQIRGGLLIISVAAKVGTQMLSASVGVKIVGTNPIKSQVKTRFPDETILKIASFESTGMRQFDTSSGQTTSPCPLWSADNKGGVGMMQITHPQPSDDEVWNWIANVTKGKQILAEKKGIAKGYPKKVRDSANFKQLVIALNAARKVAKQKELIVTLPDFTEDQLATDAIRGYNGWAGNDDFGNQLHEFRVKLDANGDLVVTEQAGSLAATCEWEQVPAADRPSASGDPDYVNHVLKQVV
jgi:hypothetical protein